MSGQRKRGRKSYHAGTGRGKTIQKVLQEEIEKLKSGNHDKDSESCCC